MNNESILDEQFANQQIYYENVISWWEVKRKYFSIGIVLLQTLLISIIGPAPTGLEATIGLSILYIIAANLMYTSGWVIELIMNHYYKSITIVMWQRKLVFTLGVLISILVTIFIYLSMLLFSWMPD